MSLVDRIASIFSEPPQLKAERENFANVLNKATSTGRPQVIKINKEVFVVEDTARVGNQVAKVRPNGKTQTTG